MERILLDTQTVLLLHLEGLSAVPARIRTVLQSPDTDRCLSAVSITEIATKDSIGKLQVSSKDVSRMVLDLRLTVLPFTGQHAHRLFGLPLHHREPFDRMIIAVALAEDVPLVSGDRAFRRYKDLHLLWR